MANEETTNFQNRRKFRVGGSGFTAFVWDGIPIAFANSVTHNAPAPVSRAVEIQPLDSRYPLQIITPGAITGGSFNVQLFEMYNQNIWDDFVKMTNLVDLSEIFLALAARNNPISMIRVINPPKMLDGKPQTPYGYMYHNCVIMDTMLNETIDVSTMQILKNLTIGYTHSTKVGNPKEEFSFSMSNTGIAGGSTGIYGGTTGFF